MAETLQASNKQIKIQIAKSLTLNKDASDKMEQRRFWWRVQELSMGLQRAYVVFLGVTRYRGHIGLGGVFWMDFLGVSLCLNVLNIFWILVESLGQYLIAVKGGTVIWSVSLHDQSKDSYLSRIWYCISWMTSFGARLILPAYLMKGGDESYVVSGIAALIILPMWGFFGCIIKVNPDYGEGVDYKLLRFLSISGALFLGCLTVKEFAIVSIPSLCVLGLGVLVVAYIEHSLLDVTKRLLTAFDKSDHGSRLRAFNLLTIGSPTKALYLCYARNAEQLATLSVKKPLSIKSFSRRGSREVKPAKGKAFK